jgi:V-type H+-transporting ATPase subunit a
LFLWSLFGYLCFLIIYKWVVGFGLGPNPPLILNVMIQMFLSLATITDENRVFSGQIFVQWILIFIAVVTVPWMLLSKPLILRRRHLEQHGAVPLKGDNDVLIDGEEHKTQKVEASHGGHGHGHDGHFDFGEIMVKQIIHTIEFVLGAISNTASYLRLWALSLAHSGKKRFFED